MARDAFRHDFSRGAVAGDTVRFYGHKNVRRVPALHRMMTVVAFHAGMFCVIEVRLRHPTIDEDRLCDPGGGVGRGGHWLHLMAKSAAIK